MSNPEDTDFLIQQNLERLQEIQDLLITKALDTIPHHSNEDESITYIGDILALPTQFERVRLLVQKQAFTLPIDVEFVDSLVSQIPHEVEDDTEEYEETTTHLFEAAKEALEHRLKEN